MEPYTTEEEQLEALRRWWKENGRSIVTVVVLALAGSVGWQAWQARQMQQEEQASDIYQALVQSSTVGAGSAGQQFELAEQLKREFSATTYAQFAALQLAAIAVNEGDLEEAEAQLNWVVNQAEPGSDIARIAQLRLARVVASTGETDRALDLLGDVEAGSYAASYAAAMGDIYYMSGRNDEARSAYQEALSLAASGIPGVSLPVLQQKLQSLTPIPVRTLEVEVTESPVTEEPASTAAPSSEDPEE